ncbi:MAG TPA: aminopeptidase [Gaiellaceae bacterium]|jgi:aminopeptidase
MDERFTALAALAVHGANVQPGQVVGLGAYLGQEELVRAIAAAAYERGALFVDVWYFDPLVKRARVAHADPDTLDFVPSWYGARFDALAERRDARIHLTGVTAPNALAGLDPALAGRDQLPYLKEIPRIVGERTTNWSIVPCPHPAWAKLVHPELDDEEAYAQLWQELWHVLRLDEGDPARAWDDRMDTLRRSAETLATRRFDRIELRGPGTELTIGLLPTATWWAADFSTADGLRHFPNLPTEEVFTTPDPERTEGHVTATKPLVFRDGTIVRGLRVRFEGGRVVEIDAEENADALRAKTELDEGAARLGELALVDRQGRIGPLGTVFYDTLLDENAASHIALGNGFAFLVDDEDAARVNKSGTHIDFMIGSDELDVTGVTSDGERVPILRNGDWQI